MSTHSLQYALATGHKITTQVAQSILLSGGNAFDATVAAYLAAFVSEPMMASAGAGGFANIITSEGNNFILDFFCQTPISKFVNNPHYSKVSIDFGEAQEDFFCGPASLAVPGAMAMISYLSEHYCTIPLKELIQPAQELAKTGCKYSSFQATDTKLLANILFLSDRGKALFSKDDKVLNEGDSFQMPQYADFLESYANEKSSWFYHGEIAKTISDYSKENHGYLTSEDFKNYQVKIQTPHTFKFQNKSISTPSLPCMGGGLMQLFLQSLENQTFSKLSKEHLGYLNNGFDVCMPYLSDPKLLFNTLSAQKDGGYSGLIPGGTSHFNIADSLGNGIALSTSIGVGSGYFIPGTDMQMNNMLGETALLPNGLSSWKENVRLNSMMTPTLCFNDSNELEMLLGTGGSSRIPFSIAQVLINKYLLNMDLDSAVHLPRIYENSDQIYLEAGYDATKLSKLKTTKEWTDLNLIFGGVHSIDLQRMEAIGDSRREGSALISIR